MTDAQIAWLKAHPEYEVVGAGGAVAGPEQMGPSGRHRGRGALCEDGTFVPGNGPWPDSVPVGVRRPPPAISGGPMR